MRKPREQETVRAILQLLHAHRIPAWRVTTGATKIGERFIRFGVVGMADIIGIQPWPQVITDCGHPLASSFAPTIGRFLAIEVKSAKGTVTLAQQAFLAQVNAAGGKAFVARTVNDVARELGFPPSPTFGGQPISWATQRRISSDGP